MDSEAKKRPKPVDISKPSTLLTGSTAINDCIIKYYIGIGWVEVPNPKATNKDYENFPEAK